MPKQSNENFNVVQRRSLNNNTPQRKTSSNASEEQMDLDLRISELTNEQSIRQDILSVLENEQDLSEYDEYLKDLENEEYTTKKSFDHSKHINESVDTINLNGSLIDLNRSRLDTINESMTEAMQLNIKKLQLNKKEDPALISASSNTNEIKNNYTNNMKNGKNKIMTRKPLPVHQVQCRTKITNVSNLSNNNICNNNIKINNINNNSTNSTSSINSVNKSKNVPNHNTRVSRSNNNIKAYNNQASQNQHNSEVSRRNSLVQQRAISSGGSTTSIDKCKSITKPLPLPAKAKAEKISVDLEIFNPVTNSVGTNTPITILQPKAQKAIPRYVNLIENKAISQSMVNRPSSAGSTNSISLKTTMYAKLDSSRLENNKKHISDSKVEEDNKQLINKLTHNNIQKEPINNVKLIASNIQNDEKSKAAPSSKNKHQEHSTDQLNKSSILTKSSSNLEKKAGK